jgi:sugar lactone lactonase YvrE
MIVAVSMPRRRFALAPWCLLAAVAAVATPHGYPSTVADLTIARSGHQATLLADGRVLATGGSDGRGTAIGVSEIFDPTAGTWTPAAPNLSPRLGHAATLLNDGRVLVVGGVPAASACEPVASAEVYDPAAERWTSTAQIPVPVGRGTVAVTLKDGRVLVAGGGTPCGDAYDSAALFDPSSNTWSKTASMNGPAQFQIGALLADGRVLVSGAATTIYDPRTARWAPLGDPRALMEAPCEGDLRTYSPALRRDSSIARATSDDCPSVTMLPAGTLLIAGGLSTSNAALSSVQRLDRRTGEDLRTWPMRVARVGHTATRLGNGAVLIAGGRDGSARIAASEIYVPRLGYDALNIATPRGPSTRYGSYAYGSWLATATNSHNNLLISYGNSELAIQLIEWDGRLHAPGASPNRPRTPEGRHHWAFLRPLASGGPDLNSIRIDERDNIWAVSALAQEVVKISPEGEVLLRFGRAGSADSEASAPRARLRRHLESPTDLAVDRSGNVFVTDGGDRPKIVKFNSRGRFLGATGGAGSRPGELDRPHSMAADASGNVYIADSGNDRIQVFDNALHLRAVYHGLGTPWAICISPGSRQFLYSVSNPDRTVGARTTGEIYKLDLDGTILGKAVGDEHRTLIHTLDHIHCRGPDTIVGLGHRSLHQITFGQ